MRNGLRLAKGAAHLKAFTLLELVLQLHGEFRRSLDPIRVTPLQAGVILYLQRHMDAKLTDAAAVLRVTLRH